MSDLPQLPEPTGDIRLPGAFGLATDGYTADQMREYATASLSSAQQRIEELERALGELMATSTTEALRFARETLDEARHYCEGPQWSPSMADQCVNAIARIDAALARGIVSPEGIETGTGSTAQPREPGRREPTRPSKGFLKGESPQATWPFAQDDKGSSKSSEP